MDTKQTLISCINLMFLESTLPDTSNNSREIVTKIIDFIDIPEGSVGGVSVGNNITIDLLNIAHWMLGKEASYKFEPTTVLQKIKSSPEKTKIIVDTFTGIIKDYDMKKEEDFSFVCKVIVEIKDDLYSHYNGIKLSEVVRKLSRDIEFSKDHSKALEYAKQLIKEVEPLTHRTTSGLHPGIVDSVDFNSVESLTETIAKATDDLNSGGILKTDIQDINNMFEGGFWPGKTYMGCALQHNFKTGMFLTFVRGFINCNKPKLIDKSKKPLILRISSENSSKDDTVWLYKNLKENETGKKVDIRSIDPDLAAKYVTEWIDKSGWYFKNYKVDPSVFCVEDLLNLMTSLISAGYEIKAFVMDYLAMLDKKGLSGDNGSDKIRDMFRRTRNFTEARGITFLTPHQLSQDAKKLKRAGDIGVKSLPKEVAGKGYTDGCTRIDQEVDGDFYFDIVKMVVNGVPRAYLEIARGKHRIPVITPEKHLYTVLPFYEVGTIRPDIDGPNSGLTRPGGDYVPDYSDEEDGDF